MFKVILASKCPECGFEDFKLEYVKRATYELYLNSSNIVTFECPRCGTIQEI